MARRSSLKVICLHLFREDVRLAKEIAGKKGMPYQVWIRSIVREAIDRETQVLHVG